MTTIRRSEHGLHAPRGNGSQPSIAPLVKQTIPVAAPVVVPAPVRPGSPPPVRFPIEGDALPSQRGTYTLAGMVSACFALSIAVGMTPEMLPMIVTSTLARGAVFLSRKKVIVKRLDAIQNFGAMDVLCTDKTGTLTQDRIVLAQHPDAWGDESAQVLKMAYLNSYYQTGLKNLLDVAVLKHADVHREMNVAQDYAMVDEMPFDFSRRRMSVVVAERDQRHLLICKGAVEEVLAACTQVQRATANEPLTPELLDRKSVV